MAEAVYVLCAFASVACALLLIRSYLRIRVRLALLTCLCFTGLAVNNVLLFVDLVMVPQVDLNVLRSAIAIVALLLLVGGLVMEDA
jgi:hypothetical protein